MSHRLTRLFLSVSTSALLATGGCVIYSRVPPPPMGAVFVMREPPPMRTEVIVDRPAPRYVWVSGFWAWRVREYVWMPGHWDVPPEHARRWTPGRWHHESRGWYWIEGHWR